MQTYVFACLTDAFSSELALSVVVTFANGDQEVTPKLTHARFEIDDKFYLFLLNKNIWVGHADHSGGKMLPNYELFTSKISEFIRLASSLLLLLLRFCFE